MIVAHVAPESTARWVGARVGSVRSRSGPLISVGATSVVAERDPDFVQTGSVDGVRRVLAGRLHSPRELSSFDPRRDEGSFVLFEIEEDGALSVWTDKYGLRPAYYRVANDGTVDVATHLRGLDLSDARIDPEALLHLYSFSVTSNDTHLVSGVRKVPPGSVLRVRDGKVTVESYFDVSSLYRPDAFAEWDEERLCTEIDRRLRESVADRTPGSRRVAVALSGGVDSGYLALQLVGAGVDVGAYTMAYGTSYNEFDRTDRLCSMLGIEARRIVVGDTEARTNFEACNAMASEPVGFNNATMRFVSAAAARDGHDTLFDGDGADRLFLGMTRYLQLERAIRAFQVLSRVGLRGLATPALGVVPGRSARAMRHAFRQWGAGLGPYPERRMDRLAPYDSGFERRIYDLAVARYARSYDDRVAADDFGTWFSYLSTQMCPELFFRDPAELHGAEGVFAVPGYWSDSIVELAFSLPTSWKLRGGKAKYILRQAAARRIDRAYWMLPKVGLQDSFLFATGTPNGRMWLEAQRDRVRSSREFELLRDMLPGGVVQPDRLIGLSIWKRALGIA